MKILKYFERKLIRLIFVIALIISVFIILLFAKNVYKFVFRENIKIEKIEDEISAAVKKIEILIEFAQNAPLELATILEIHNVDKTENEILLRSILFNNPEFSGVSICYEPYKSNKDSVHLSSFLYRDKDTLVYTSFNNIEGNYFYKDWYLVPKTLMEPTWSEPYYNELKKGTLNSTYSVPFSFFDGTKKEFKGIVSLNLDVNELIKYSEEFGAKMNGQVLLISENGTILSSKNKVWVYNETIFSLASEYDEPILREIGRNLQRGVSGRVLIKKFNNETDMMVFYHPVSINKWGFLLFLPQTELEK